MIDRIHPVESTSDIVYILQERSEKKIWTFAGGKGGTGKTAMVANIGVALATMGYQVILVDADLGGANLHTILNIKQAKITLSDFISRRVNSLNDVLLETPSENLRLISGGSDILGIANLPYQSKLRFTRHIDELEADFILLDLGAGINYNTLDFFVLSNEGFIVSNPEPIAKINAYSFLKSVVYRLVEREFPRGTLVKEVIMNEGKHTRKGSLAIPELLRLINDTYPDSLVRIKEILSNFRPKLIMNKVRRYSQEREGKQFAGLSLKYLCVPLQYLGLVREDNHVVDSSEIMMPFILQYPGCCASKDIYHLLGALGIKDKLGRFSQKSSSQLKRFIKSERQYWYSK